MRFGSPAQKPRAGGKRYVRRAGGTTRSPVEQPNGWSATHLCQSAGTGASPFLAYGSERSLSRLRGCYRTAGPDPVNNVRTPSDTPDGGLAAPAAARAAAGAAGSGARGVAGHRPRSPRSSGSSDATTCSAPASRSSFPFSSVRA